METFLSAFKFLWKSISMENLSLVAAAPALSGRRALPFLKAEAGAPGRQGALAVGAAGAAAGACGAGGSPGGQRGAPGAGLCVRRGAAGGARRGPGRQGPGGAGRGGRPGPGVRERSRVRLQRPPGPWMARGRRPAVPAHRRAR